ncbi:hypothetical protein B0A55_03908 [Friedmanniomyces simplex]|uniref:Protein-lysine N-methyltransferase EFM6 n=1 Tax=Friedmanniomyces simplex TaxID=329884 RepID=A0A4U0XNL1_9PEZI|nr:hypothetical protein B0A55_03908 [Friedmanniomyces simplex]
MPDRSADSDNHSDNHIHNNHNHSNNDEAEDETPFTISESLVPSPRHQQARTTQTDFDGLLPQDTPLRLAEDLAKGNGGQAWPAGYVLARYLLRRKLGELGGAGAILAVALAMKCRPPPATTSHGPPVVYLTDQAPMLALMQQNILLNGLVEGRQVQACVYDWGAGNRPASIPERPDVVLAADCVYFEPAFPLLLQTLEELLRGEGSVCYFCFKRRRRADMQFLRAARRGFVVGDVGDDPEGEGYARENIFLCVHHQATDTGR